MLDNEKACVGLRRTTGRRTVAGQEYKTDQELVAAVLRGDTAAERQFVLRFQRLIYAVLHRMRLEGDEIEDLFQQVFLHLWSRKRHCLRKWQGLGKGEFSSFLSVVIVRVAQDHLRRRRAQSRLEVDSLDADLTDEPHAVMDLTLSLERAEQRAAILRVMGKLATRDAELLQRRYYGEQSYREIASGMGLTVNHVGVALTRAEKRFAQRLRAAASELFDETEAVCSKR